MSDSESVNGQLSRYFPHPIGIFDSGIGGLSVLRALRAELPQEAMLYVADSGHAPYGERGTAHVLSRSRAIANYLVSQHVKALVVACNTATAAAIAQLRLDHPHLPIIGVEPALKPAALISQTHRIGVMATRSTLASAKFQTLLAAQSGTATFVLQACDGLASAIERSTLGALEAQNSAAHVQKESKIIALCELNTSAMGLFGTQVGQIDTLVLGCTHYPFAAEHLRRLVGPHVQLVDTGQAVARQTRQLLASQLQSTEPQTQPIGHVSLFTTGQPATLQAAACRWLGESRPVGVTWLSI